MPVSPADTVDLARAIARIYEDAEDALFGLVSQALAEGIESPRWAEAKLMALGDLRRALQQVTDALQRDASGAISAAVEEAYRRGGQSAVAELGALDEERRAFAMRHLPGASQADRLARAAVAEQGPTWQRILREPLDIYRSVVARVAGNTLLGTLTRRATAQRALDSFARNGISSFTDVAGRRWNMASYAEMAVRSTTARAAIDGHVDQLQALGEQLVIVSDAILECPLCLVPGTVVEGPVPTGRTRSEYTGNVVRIVTASGNDLTGTPDHPVLTPRGWVALKDLSVGDQVISHDREKGYAGVMPDDVQVPTRIEEAGKSRLPVLLSGPTRRDLNQNIAYRKVRYVAADSDLPTEFDPALSEPVPEHLLVPGVGESRSLLGLDNAPFGLFGPSGSSVGVMHGIEHGGALFGSGVLPALEEACGCEGGSLFMGESGHVADDGMVAGPRLDASAAQVVADYPTADAEGGAELLRALTGKVTADEIVSLSVSEFSGHVWDLSTEPSWYVANGIVTHNCRPWEGEVLAINGQSGPHSLRLPKAIQPTGVRAAFRPPETTVVHVAGSLAEARAAGLYHPNCKHSLSAFLPGVTERPPQPAHPQGATYEDTQQQRYYERQVRAWKRRAAASMDDASRRQANARVRAYQARIRELVDTKGLVRKPHREQNRAR